MPRSHPRHRVLVLTLSAVLALSPAAATAAPKPTTPTAPATVPDTSHCPYKQSPPPAVDLSEVPAPGQPTPGPVPVPASPVGGARMGECGPVLPPGALPPPNVLFESWVLADLDSGEVVAARDPHARHRPASIIKVLLSLVVLRELKMDAVVEATQEDANQHGTRVGIGPGGQYTNEQLLQSLLMRSGNDVAHALARQLGGIPATLAKMNTLAKSLGALDIRAATPSGLDGPGMSASAYDMALVFREAMRDKRFATAVATKRIDFPGYGGKPGFVVANDNRLLSTYPGNLGGKTGFTDDAQHTYINAAQRGSTRLVLVGMRGDMHPAVEKYNQSKQLLDYGFALRAAASQPVGQLVSTSPGAQPTPDAAPQGGAATAEESGGIGIGTVVLIVFLGLLAAGLGLFVWLRRGRGV
ncbi:D-alanyl-D-alanine carboxypeptidase (penicillin-binding protein 5/6) [Crossiella equi]|uniref:D-alanyl-D-alanine carboxypeptidase (Penicillin-binding protein 5/6) n=1 Tax=Crossiella equi TaxID=130796 RepID=A0ABS5A635_9PSEU|nr:serine hydrolase [Crossiella equi]MBP2471190.1 D-alanyl-D-alanine carboxypeptidase (penicillin-binding protein 5/6) [Crossiella equi]